VDLDPDHPAVDAVETGEPDAQPDLGAHPELRRGPPRVVEHPELLDHDVIAVERVRAIAQVDEGSFARARQSAEVCRDRVVGRAFELDAPVAQEDASRAQRLDRGHVVADEEDRARARGCDFAHLAETLALELRVTDGQHLVDDEDLWVEVRGDRECESHAHATAVALHRRVEKGAGAGELDDLVEVAGNRLARHPHDRAVEIDVLAPRELGVEAGTDLEEAADGSAQPDLALAGLGDAAEDLQQRALPGAVSADEAENLSAADFEVYVREGPELFYRSPV